MIGSLLRTARTGTYAYVGALAMVGDRITEAFDRFEQRGAQFEQTARTQLQTLTGTVRDEVVSEGQAVADKVEAAYDETANVRDHVLHLLQIPTQTSVENLNRQVTRLSIKVDVLNSTLRTQEEPALEEPFPGYDTLNVEDVLARLAQLDTASLHGVRTYEEHHDNRVMVMREVERLLLERSQSTPTETPVTVEPLPRYDELRADEITERLSSLSEAELLQVKQYETEHQNRVTVTRAVDKLLSEQDEN
ncbi:MAG: phasin family protein [Chloroflexota bacterium]